MALLASPAPAAPKIPQGQYFFGTAQIYEWCKAGDFHCAGYVAAIADYELTLAAVKPETALFCPPKQFTVREAIMIFQKYVEDDPKRLSHDGAGTVAMALVTAYPCQ